ncbi:MAG TPA: hypothetical protein VEH84_02325 [Alphaproteobacteria bacterium]|nr:hypothetical protein [Alphaproteobacteria bacterium]
MLRPALALLAAALLLPACADTQSRFANRGGPLYAFTGGGKATGPGREYFADYTYVTLAPGAATGTAAASVGGGVQLSGQALLDGRPAQTLKIVQRDAQVATVVLGMTRDGPAPDGRFSIALPTAELPYGPAEPLRVFAIGPGGRGAEITARAEPLPAS